MSSLINSEVYSIIKKDLECLEGKIILLKGNYCGGKNKCSGLFYLDSQDDPVIKVAKGGLTEEEWFGILLHEYCHFLQWRDESKFWEQFADHDVTYSHIISKPQKHKISLISLMELEINCEKCVTNIIKKNKLFDHKTYAQSANAILYKYAFLYKYSKWPDDNRKYKKVQDFCPTKILKSYKEYLEIPESVIQYYK
jgi:hypothetical protein